MQRLLSRQKQVPNGFTFRQPQINWDSRRALGMHPSFDTLVNAVISARRANAAQSAQHKLSTDRATVEMEVETYNVKVCLANGWTNYLTEVGGGSAVPLSPAASPQEQSRLAAAANHARKIWAGVKISNDWMDAADFVPAEQSTARAAVCVACPLNSKEGEGKSLIERLAGFFTEQAALAIKRQIERKNQLKLSTPHDANLFVCTGCLCPLESKVHSPIKYIKAYTSPEVFAELRDKGNRCWVVKEMEAT